MASGSNKRDASKDPAASADRAQDPIVARRRPDPAQPPEPTLDMAGFLGDSDRTGYRRLYFTRELDYYAEFRVEDVAQMASIAADEQPFLGEEATRVSLRRDATVEYTRTRTALSFDEFDLDIRIGRPSRVSADYDYTGMDYTQCEYHTCPTSHATACETQCETNCGTCQTACGACLVPYTVDDPTCSPTCDNPAWNPTCNLGCQPIVRHGPSDIDTACVTQCGYQCPWHWHEFHS